MTANEGNALNTDQQQPDRHWRGLRRALRPRRGIALIITLTIMALLLIMAVAFVSNMRTERIASRAFSDRVKAREMAMTGLHAAIAKLDYFYTQANLSNYVVATMPGRFYGMSSWTNAVVLTNNMFTTQPNEHAELLTVYSQKRAVNLNGGSYLWGQQTLPIVNPYGNLTSPSPCDINNVAIWAEWMPVWRTADADFKVVKKTVGIPQKEGIEGRFAFWIDDESVKINLSNAGSTTVSNILFATSGNSAPFGFVEPASGGYAARHFSSVNPAALDEPTSGGNWSNSRTLDQLESERNPSSCQWRPLRTPEDALGSCNPLTIEDYEKAKFCLTTWSEDVDNFSQIFRRITTANFKAPVIRTNVSSTLMTTQQRDGLFTNLVMQLRSKPLTNHFAGASYDWDPDKRDFLPGAKFASLPPNVQPLLLGGVEQIAANIVAYMSDPNLPPVVTDGTIADKSTGRPKIVTLSGTSIPRGACGVCKSAYMNEIVVGFGWQRIPPKPPATDPQWMLWAAIYVELINPYEVDMPRSGETYRILFDGDIKFEVGAAVVPAPDPQPVIKGAGDLTIATAAVPRHGYSSPTDADSGTKLLVTGQPVKVLKDPITSKNAPTLNTLTCTLPQIRMLKGAAATKILDWFDPKQVATPKAFDGKFDLVSLKAIPPITGVTGAPDDIANFLLATKNPARISIGKNDPRVRFWTDPPSIRQNITIKNIDPPKGATYTPGENCPTVFYTGGDIETYNTRLNKSQRQNTEWFSNFVIAERGMASVGELGFIHTGKPWRSLSLQRYGALSGELDQIASPSRPAAIPDWAIMDLLTVNSGPVHGRININNAGWQAEADATDTVWGTTWKQKPVYQTRTQPNLFRPVGSQVLGTGRRTAVPAGSTTTTPLRHTLDAALSFITDKTRRYNLVDGIVRRRAAVGGTVPILYRPYYTIGELAEVYYMNSYDITQPSKNAINTDASREDMIRRISNVVTTRSDVFCVWVTGQAFWEYWSVLGEARLMAIVQRYPVFLPNVNNPTSVASRWRIRHLRWITD